MKWTPERVATLQRMAEDGCSYQLIADELGVTRSMVAGKAHRLGLRLGVHGERKVKARPKRGHRRPASASPPTEEKSMIRFRSQVKRFWRENPVEREQGTCCWPYGDGPFFFCGAPSLTPPYCDKHLAMSRRRGEA